MRNYARSVLFSTLFAFVLPVFSFASQGPLLDLVASYMKDTTSGERSSRMLIFTGAVFPTVDEYNMADKKWFNITTLMDRIKEGKPSRLTHDQQIIQIIGGHLELAKFGYKNALSSLKRIFEEGIFGMPMNSDYVRAFEYAIRSSHWDYAASLMADGNMEEYDKFLKERRGDGATLKKTIPAHACADDIFLEEPLSRRGGQLSTQPSAHSSTEAGIVEWGEEAPLLDGGAFSDGLRRRGPRTDV